METSQQQQQLVVEEERTTIEGCWILDKTRDNWTMNDYLHVMNVDPLAIEAHEKGEREHDTYHTIEFIRNHENDMAVNANIANKENDNNNIGIKIIKRSRVNNDVIVNLVFGQEYVQYLQPNNRVKSSMASSDHPGHVCIQSKLVTTDNHGTALVTDVKRLIVDSPAPDPATSNRTDATTANNDTSASEPSIKNDSTDIVANSEEVVTETTTITSPLQDQQQQQTARVLLLQELTIVNKETGQSHTTRRYFLPYNDTPPHLVPPATTAIIATITGTDDMNDE